MFLGPVRFLCTCLLNVSGSSQVTVLSRTSFLKLNVSRAGQVPAFVLSYTC